MGIRKSVFITVGQKTTATLTDNSPIGRSVLKKDEITSQVTSTNINIVQLLESFIIEDAGSAFIQNYTSEYYFLEDYVGQSFQFT